MSRERSRAFSARPRVIASLGVLAVIGLAIAIESQQFTLSLQRGDARERAARVSPTLATPLMRLASMPEHGDPSPSSARTAGAAPIWKPGYEWHYRWTDPRGSGTYIRSVLGEESIDGVSFYLMQAENRVVYLGKADLGWVMEQVNGKIESQAVPAYRKFVWPLQPGKTWESRYHWSHPEEQKTEERVRRHRVTAIETIQVPAGAFQAHRVVVTDAAGKKVNEYWYAPDVRWLVKERIYITGGVRERELIYASLWPKTATR